MLCGKKAMKNDNMCKSCNDKSEKADKKSYDLMMKKKGAINADWYD
jgi:hypothetical protein